jgi:hypothetical protein
MLYNGALFFSTRCCPLSFASKKPIARAILIALIFFAGLIVAAEVAAQYLLKNTDFFAKLTNQGSGIELGSKLPLHLQQGSTYDYFSGYRLADIDPTGRRPPSLSEPPKAPGEVRIVVLGDSVTFGHGLDADQAWPARLEHYLNEPSPTEVRFKVYNCAVPGHDERQTKRLLQSHYLKLEPDIVLWSKLPTVNDQLELPPTSGPVRQYLQSLVNQSGILKVWTMLLRPATNSREGTVDAYGQDTGGFPVPPPQEPIVAIGEFARWVEARGVSRFLGVEQIYPVPCKNGVGRCMIGSSQFWRKTGVDCAPLAGRIASENLSVDLLFAPNDAHLTVQGADAMGRLVSLYIRKIWFETVDPSADSPVFEAS